MQERVSLSFLPISVGLYVFLLFPLVDPGCDVRLVPRDPVDAHANLLERLSDGARRPGDRMSLEKLTHLQQQEPLRIFNHC